MVLGLPCLPHIEAEAGGPAVLCTLACHGVVQEVASSQDERV